jgi:hypothetical protein
MTNESPLDVMLNGMNGRDVYALVNEDKRVLRKLGALREVAFAAGQLACLIGAMYLYRQANDGRLVQWNDTKGLFATDTSVEELLQAVGQPESPLVYSVLHAAYYQSWPQHSIDFSGYKATSNGMGELARLATSPRWSPVSDMTKHTAVSVRKRFDEAHKAFAGRGVKFHNETLLRELRANLGYCHLLAVDEFEHV